MHQKHIWYFYAASNVAVVLSHAKINQMPKIDTILLFQSQGLAFLVDVMYNGTGLGYSTANTPICYFLDGR